jgi:PPK2 family polyphosphate:nucleotide phosphotransferase
VGKPVKLSDYDPAYRGERRKREGEAALPGLAFRLNELQDLLYADGRFAVLVVLQGMDTSGKDGTIRHVFQDVGPLGCQAVAFGVPSVDEAQHDFLWRYHRNTPGKGHVVIFNRSHYEGVLVERVKGIVPEDVWRRRYDQINAFETMLASEATLVLKFFLHISKEEQRARIQSRLDNPTKRWKFRRSDIEDRVLWNNYQHAYEEALTRCNTESAPWHIVPADRKWYRDIVVATALIEGLESLKLRYPEPVEDLTGVVVE